MPNIIASFLYAGLPDYWQGNSKRWYNNNGCLFAPYGGKTTLREIIDGAVDDFEQGGGDCDSLGPKVTSADIRGALLAMLNNAGRVDYDNGGIADCAVDHSEANNLNACLECGELVDDAHDEACTLLREQIENKDRDDDDTTVYPEDCPDEDDYEGSPICIFLIETESCNDCGDWADLNNDHVCAACAGKTSGGLFANEYDCPCGAGWAYEHSCTCSDRCPECGKEIEPTRSEDVGLAWPPCFLQPGDEVYWNDPKNEDSRKIDIDSITIVGKAISIVGADGSVLECFDHELE